MSGHQPVCLPSSYLLMKQECQPISEPALQFGKSAIDNWQCFYAPIEDEEKAGLNVEQLEVVLIKL